MGPGRRWREPAGAAGRAHPRWTRTVHGAACWLVPLVLLGGARSACAREVVYAALGATVDLPDGPRPGDPARIAQLAQSGGGHVSLLDLTAPDATARAVLASQLKRAIGSRPTLVTLALGPADACGGTPLSSFARDLEVISDFLQRTGATVVISTIGHAELLCGPSGSRIAERVDAFNFTILREARRHHLVVADVRRPFLLQDRSWVAAVQKVVGSWARESTAVHGPGGPPDARRGASASRTPRPPPESA